MIKIIIIIAPPPLRIFTLISEQIKVWLCKLYNFRKIGVFVYVFLKQVIFPVLLLSIYLSDLVFSNWKQTLSFVYGNCEIEVSWDELAHCLSLSMTIMHRGGNGLSSMGLIVSY